MTRTFWFVPALVLLLDVAATRGAPHRGWYTGFGVLLWVTVTFSVIAWYDWGILPHSIMYNPLAEPLEAWELLLMIAILAVLMLPAVATIGWSAMPWKCPACQEAIRHRPHEEKPRLGVRYRCPICRLELVLDPRTYQLIVAPLDENDRKSPGTR